MKRWTITAAVAAACSTATLGVGIAIGARRTPLAAASAAPTREQPSGPRRVRFPAELAQRSGLRTERVARQTLLPAIELVGSVGFDASRLALVGGRIAGRVTRLYASVGAEVREGQPLAEIESAALGEITASLLSARANGIAARARLRRETDLARQQLTTASALEVARADAAQYAAEARGAEQQLLAMGVSPGAARGAGATRVTLRSPITGRVVAREAVVGQTVDATGTVFRIADLSSLWVQLDVFERDLSRVHPGDRTEIMSETYPGRTFTGVVNHVADTIDTNTRTARVRIVVGNQDLLLRPGQFVTARVRTSSAAPHEVVSIPRAATVQLEGRPAVFVQVAPEQYEMRTVQLGAVEGDRVEVVRGLSDGDQLVVDGAFALKSEMQR